MDEKKIVYVVVNDLYSTIEAVFDDIALANMYLANHNRILKDGANEMSIEQYELNNKT